MNALVYSSGACTIRRLPIPRPAAGQVLVRVHLAGVCRTDLQVARGTLACTEPVTLGHELSGVVAQVGDGVVGVSLGDRVSAVPWHKNQRLGVEVDGAFADYVLLHQRQVVHVPDHLSMRRAAYTEPVAAALGVLLTPPLQGRVLILGQGRIAQLASRVLAAEVPGCTVHVAQAAEPNAWDVVIEADPHPLVLQLALEAVRPGGRVVLKSRADIHLSLPLQLAISKAASLHPVGHGSFERAVGLLGSPALQIDDLLGAKWPLSQWREAFAASEDTKVFLEPGA